MRAKVAVRQTSPCTRCGAPVMLNAYANGEVLELCAACDRDDPAAAQMIAWVLVDGRGSGGNRAATEEGARLMTAWMKSEMAKRGWEWVDTDAGPAT